MDVRNFLQNATSTAAGWGGLFLILLGTIGLIVIAVKVWAYINADRQKRQQMTGPGWLALGFLFSGALVTGGFVFIQRLSAGGQRSFEDLTRGGVILPFM